ncbi:hypothetical protein ATCC90586_006951 [Pythium insidiosum]|nr:hypothetical protein ATCC90586_006951 [Pythium insidiosum]
MTATATHALRRQLLTMARYNVWATRRLLGCVDALSDDEYRRDVGLFFASVHGTLNHLLVAEHDVWFARIHDRHFPSQLRLDAEAESDRARLREALLTRAERWIPLLQACDDATLEGELAYKDLSGTDHRLPFAPTMAHISAALTMLGHPGPELDSIYMLQEELHSRQ